MKIKCLKTLFFLFAILGGSLFLILFMSLQFAKHQYDLDGISSERNLMKIIAAMDEYYNSFGHYPPAVVRIKDGVPLYSWRVALLPFLQNNEIYEQFKHDEPWDSELNKSIVDKMPSIFAKPGIDAPAGYTYYQVLIGPGTAFEKDGLKKEDFPNRFRTIFLVEAKDPVPWTKPEDLSYAPDKPLPPFFGDHLKEGWLNLEIYYKQRLFHVGFGGGEMTTWFARGFDENQLRKMIERDHKNE